MTSCYKKMRKKKICKFCFSSAGDLDVLADKLLMFKLDQSAIHGNSLKSIFKKNIVTSGTPKYLNQNKEALLHKWHKNHVVINTKPTKRQQITEVNLVKYSKKTVNISPYRSILKNVKSDQKQSNLSQKNIFTVSKPTTTLSSQILNSSEQQMNLKDKNAENLNTPQKSEPANGISSQFFLSKNETTPVKSGGGGDIVENVSDGGLQISYGNLNPSHSSQPINVTTADSASDSIELPSNASQLESNNFTNSETKIGSNDLNTKSTIQEYDKSLQSGVVTGFESNLFTKTVTTTATSLINPIGVTTGTESQLKNIITTSTPVEGSLSSNLTEIKDGSKKESVEAAPVAHKEVTTEAAKANTSFLFSGMSFVSSPSNVIVTNSVTSASSPPSVNIFGNSPAPGQNTLLNFTKSPIFSNLNPSQTTTPVKSTSIFGNATASGTTSPATTYILPTNIWAVNPQFVATSTTSSSVTSPVTSKPASVTSSTASETAVTTTATFFCKPSSMKSLFANSQVPTTNVTPAFKTTTILETPVFATIHSQQQVSAPIVSSTSTIQTSTPVSTSTSVNTSPSSTPANVIISSGIPSTAFSSTFTTSSVTTTLESSTTNNLPISSESISASAAATAASTSLTPVSSPTAVTCSSTPVNEKETTASTFGVTSTVPTIFGSKSSEQNISVFSTTGASSPTNTFGKTATTSGFTPPISTGTSIFAAAASKPSIFGNQNATHPFGNSTTTTTSSIFTTTASSVFGGTSSTKTTTASIFGGTASFGAPTTTNASVFGAAAALSSTSFFGSTLPATTSSNFGTTPTASPFSTPTTTSTSFFGQPVCSPTSTVTNVFSNISFAQKSPPATTAGSIFGGNRSFETKPLFQLGATTAAAGAGAAGGVFGQTTSSPGSFGTSGGSLFGGKSTFGSPQQQTNLFQSPTGASGNLFGSRSPQNSGLSGGSFSTGNQSVAQSGFGTLPNFQNAAKPFGNTSPPAFGTQSSFGSSPTFGGSATFGTPNKVFGTLPPGSSAFGSPTQQQSSTFENLAGQNTLSFGNLAQGQPTFNASPSFASPQQQQQQQQQTTFPTGSSFGGSSFSTWR